jgi:PAS domain S-box-containing protein
MPKHRIEITDDHVFQALVENSFDVIAIVDESEVFRYVSPSITRVLGWEPDELLGRPFHEFLPNETREWATELNQRIMAQRDFDSIVEAETLHKNGSRRFIEVAIRNMLDDPAVEGLVLNYRDVTERWKWEKLLRQSEERYSKAFKLSPDGIAISRFSDGVFVEVNESFERITGFTRAEMVGRSSLALNHWKDPKDRERLVEEVQRQRVVREFEAEFRDKQGHVHVGQLSAEVIDFDGETCMLTTMRDITERLRSEQRLERLNRRLGDEHRQLEQTNAELSNLLARVQDEKSSYRRTLTADVDNLVRPLIRRLKVSGGTLTPTELDTLAHRLDIIVSREVGGYQDNLAKLTAREREVCDLIQRGGSSRQIAQELGLSPETVNKHRQSIRRKLQIDHRGINLTSYLRSR